MLKHVGQPHRPNILLIITDQQRADAVGYANSKVLTPNIDRLARQAIVCSNAFTQSPQCQPSRASIFTGRYPTAHRVWWNETALPPMEVTLANYLSKAGYQTAYFGKLHFDGAGSHTMVARRFGFQHAFLMEDWQELVSMVDRSLGGRGMVAQEFYGPMSTPFWTGRLTNKGQHHEEVVTARALNFIATATRPYLVVVGFHGPHPPYAAPDEFSSLYQLQEMSVPVKPVVSHDGSILSDDDWRRLKVQYYGSISWIDDCVGKLLEVVDSNTVVIYTSDHGDILGDHGYFSKGLFAYEGNVKVPLVIRLPDCVPGVYTHLVQLIDLVPTLCGLAGVSGLGLQGVSLLDHLRAVTPATDRVVSMIGHGKRLRMVRTTSHKYWYFDGQEVLFDLVADPGEEVNLVHDRQLLGQLRFCLLEALVRCEDPLPIPRPPGR